MAEKDNPSGRRRNELEATESAERAEPVIGQRLEALRDAFGLTQVALVALMAQRHAENGGRSGTLDQSYISGVENGRLAAGSENARSALAAAYRITRDELADYIDGVTDLVALIDARNARRPAFHRLPMWEQFVAEARTLSRRDTSRALKAIGSWPMCMEPPDAIDAQLLASLAEAIDSWEKRRARPKQGT